MYSKVLRAGACLLLAGVSLACSDTGDDAPSGGQPQGGTLIPAGTPPLGGQGAGTSGSVVAPSTGGASATGGSGGVATNQEPMPPMTAASDAAVVADGGEPDSAVPVEACAANLEQNPAGADPCTAPLRPGEDRLCEFSYNGAMRKFYLYAPPSYDACTPAAMVMDCHGATESAEVHIGQAGFNPDSPLGYGSSWRRAIQGDNAIVVTPEGVGLFWSEANDPAFLNEVADMVEAVADVDPEKRYLTGISMGGMITVETGCKDTNRWRGMVPVSMLSNTCPSIARPIPHMAFHAETDAITSYADDRDLADDMVALNHCDATPETLHFGGPNSSPDAVCFETPYGPGSPDAPDPYAVPLAPCPTDRPESSCQVWTGCDDGVEVVFCTVEAANQVYGGHLLYTNDTGLNLAALAWPFLKKFWP